MKVSKRNWFYKLAYVLLEFDKPSNLCVYFWKTYVFLPILAILAILFALAVGAFIFTVLIAPIYWIISGTFLLERQAFLIIGLICYIILSILTILFAFDRYKPKFNKIVNSVPYQYLKGVHDKVCPLIEYVD